MPPRPLVGPALVGDQEVKPLNPRYLRTPKRALNEREIVNKTNNK